MFIFIFIPVIVLLLLGIILIVALLALRARSGKKPKKFIYNGHVLEVLVALTIIKIFYDGKIVDEYSISTANTVGVSFREYLDGVEYKINVGNSGLTPKVTIFANNEKVEEVINK